MPFFIGLKGIKIIDYFSLIFAFLLFGWCGSTPDTDVYLFRYYSWDENWINEITEPLYTQTVCVFNLIGFSYQEFFISVSLLFICCYYLFIKKMTNQISYVTGLMLVSIYPMLITLQRNTYAFCFVFIAFCCLLFCKKNIVKGILFSLFILLATLIHSLCCLYLLFAVAYYVNEKKIIIYTLIGVAILSSIISILPLFVNDVFDLFGIAAKSELFFSDETGDIKASFLAFLRVVSVLILPLGLNIILKQRYNAELVNIDKCNPGDIVR